MIPFSCSAAKRFGRISEKHSVTMFFFQLRCSVVTTKAHVIGFEVESVVSQSIARTILSVVLW